MEKTGERMVGAQDETKWAPLTTEFWVMFLLIIAILIAAAISDSFGDRRAWTLVTVIGAAYILSRGLAKGGTDHTPFRRGGRRT
jgi:hypothetical protein